MRGAGRTVMSAAARVQQQLLLLQEPDEAPWLPQQLRRRRERAPRHCAGEAWYVGQRAAPFDARFVLTDREGSQFGIVIVNLIGRVTYFCWPTWDELHALPVKG